MIKVVRGNPTPEELAAAVTVVRARVAAAACAARHGGRARGTDAWADPSRVARTRLPAPGPRAWDRTFRPG